MNWSLIVAACALALASGGCSSTSSGQSSGGSSGDSDKGGQTISAGDLSGDWPLTVDSGTLHCDGSGGTGKVTFEADGKVYAVNGLAKQSGLPEIDEIWKDDPGIPGGKLNIGELLQAGLDLCE